MKFLQSLTAWSNAELAVLKICMGCFGVSMGILFYDYVQSYFNYFFVVFFVTAIWTFLAWLRKMSKKPSLKQ